MPRRTLDDNDLLRLAQRHVEYLLADAAQFDSGAEHLSARAATSLRTLLHTGNEPPLLAQLGVLRKLQFLDTSSTMPPYSVGADYPLLILNGGRFYPKLDGGPEAPAGCEFDDWWNQIAIRDAAGNTATRGQLVKWRANKEEVHVAAVLSGAYEALSNPDSRAAEIVFPDGQSVTVPMPIVATLRQVSHELLRTLAVQVPTMFNSSDALAPLQSGDVNPHHVYALTGVTLSAMHGTGGTGFFVENPDGSITIGGADSQSENILRRLAEDGHLGRQSEDTTT